MSFVCSRCTRTIARPILGRQLATSARLYPRRWTPFEAPTLPPQADFVAEAPEEPAWYIDRDFLAQQQTARQQAAANKLDLPSRLPVHLQNFAKMLHESPFFSSVTVLDAKDTVAALCDWTFLCQLRSGRERSIRGVAQRYKEELATLLRTDSPAEARSIRIEGISVNEMPTWALIDAGSVIVHIQTAESAGIYDLSGRHLDNADA